MTTRGVARRAPVGGAVHRAAGGAGHDELRHGAAGAHCADVVQLRERRVDFGGVRAHAVRARVARRLALFHHALEQLRVGAQQHAQHQQHTKHWFLWLVLCLWLGESERQKNKRAHRGQTTQEIAQERKK